jgi:hypothetical protein
VKRIVCFFANHKARPVWKNGAYAAWTCDRCGYTGPKLWMTGAWFVDWLRHGRSW